MIEYIAYGYCTYTMTQDTLVVAYALKFSCILTQNKKALPTSGSRRRGMQLRVLILSNLHSIP